MELQEQTKSGQCCFIILMPEFVHDSVIQVAGSIPGRSWCRIEDGGRGETGHGREKDQASQAQHGYLSMQLRGPMITFQEAGNSRSCFARDFRATSSVDVGG